jgi:hypothetical protein
MRFLNSLFTACALPVFVCLDAAADVSEYIARRVELSRFMDSKAGDHPIFECNRIV